jgi:DNA-binding NarL/FixJ family response regulator
MPIRTQYTLMTDLGRNSTVRPLPLRGRSEDMDRALRSLREVKRTRQSSALLVCGEAGIGKSAFAAELTEQARRMGFAISASKADDLNQSVPWAAMIGALRSGPKPMLSDDDFRGLAQLYDQQIWMVERLASLIEGHTINGPALIAIDDVQLADRLSVFALRAMLLRLARSPVIWLLTTRLDPDPSLLLDGLTDVVSGDVPLQTIELGPLAAGAIEQLAADHRGTAPDEKLRQQLTGAGGNPLLAVELVSGSFAGPSNWAPAEAAADRPGPLPAGLMRVARAWLAELPVETRRLLEVGSVLGHSFEVADAAALLGGPASKVVLPWLAPAMRIGVLTDHSGAGVEFRHDLVRQAVYESLSGAVRKALHAAAAEHLLGSGLSPVDAARHVLASATKGDSKAVETLRRAAAIIAPASPAAGVEMISQALRLLRPDDAAWQTTGNEAIAILTRAHRPADAVSLADELLAAHPSDEAQAQIESLAAYPLWDLGQLDEIRARIDRVLAFRDISPGLRVRLQALRGLAMSRDPDDAAAGSESRTALLEAQRLNDDEAQAVASRALGEVARNNGFNQDAAEHFRQLATLTAGWHMVDEILTQQDLDHYDSSEQLLHQARIARGEGAEQDPAFAYARMWHDFNLGLLEDAQAGAATVLRSSHDGPHLAVFQIEARLMLANLARLRGDIRLARRHMASAYDHRQEDRLAATTRQIAETYAADMEGDLVTAVAALSEVLSPATAFRHRLLVSPSWLMATTRIAVQANATDLAKQSVQLAETLCERNPGQATFAGAAAYCRGLLLADTSDLEAAVTALRGSPRPQLLADALKAMGEALVDHDHDRAVAALDEAWEIFHGIGALGEVVRVQRILRSAGVRRRRWSSTVTRPEHGWEALTMPEKRVARLVAAGHTNRSVAAELCLSPNTVATHLRTIFQKLEVSSRVQLARQLVSMADYVYSEDQDSRHPANNHAAPGWGLAS